MRTRAPAGTRFRSGPQACLHTVWLAQPPMAKATLVGPGVIAAMAREDGEEGTEVRSSSLHLGFFSGGSQTPLGP